RGGERANTIQVSRPGPEGSAAPCGRLWRPMGSTLRATLHVRHHSETYPMKVVLASVSFATPYTPQLRFLSLGYLHANAMADEVIAAETEIVHEYFDPSLRDAKAIAAAIAAHRPDVVGFTCYV